MLRNSNAIASNLNDEQIEVLQKLGFERDTFILTERTIDKNTKRIIKTYGCCGGALDLIIVLRGDFFGKPSVRIETPMNWTYAKWTLSEFSKDMEEFQNQLQSDLKTLRKIGIIS